jgi:hypothetical protein
VLYAFDLIEQDGDDLCDLPLMAQVSDVQTDRHGQAASSSGITSI